MVTRPVTRIALGAALLAALSTMTTPAAAQQSGPDVQFPAGVACPFGLDVFIGGPGPDVRTFLDRDGNLVRTITAGRGSSLAFVNSETGAKYTTAPNGSVSRIDFYADGSLTGELTGHYVLILFPADIPAGPTTTLYTGRVVYTVDGNGIFTLQKSAGRMVDICAALSS